MEFDAIITINDHHLEAAGLTGCKAVAVAAVRQAVERIAGAGWIDVAAHYFPPETPGWVTLYPRDEATRTDGPEWRDLASKVEQIALMALTRAFSR